jgi:hypothetical protein
MRRVLLPALVALLSVVSALFEDQAGKIDWARENIGGVTHALFQVHGASRLAIVATSEGVLAGLDLRSGTTQWRQLLHPGESVCELVSAPGLVLSLGVAPHGPRTVGTARLWNAKGELLWDYLSELPEGVSSRGCPSGVFTQGSSSQPRAVLIGYHDAVTAIAESSGAQLWRWRSADQQTVHRLALSGGEALAYGLKRDGGGAFRAKLDLQSGALIGTLDSLGTDAALPLQLTHEGTLLAVDTAGKNLLVSSGSSGRLSKVALSGLGSCEGQTLSSTPPSLQPLVLPRAAVLSLGGGGVGGGSQCSLLVEIGTDGTASTSRTVSGEHQFAAAHRDGVSTLSLVTASHVADTANMRLEQSLLELTHELSHAPPKGRLGLEWKPAEAIGEIEGGARGSLRAAWLNSYLRKGGVGYGARILVATADDSLALVAGGGAGGAGGAGSAGGRASWVREEALAYITGAELLPLPILVADGEEEDVAGGRASFGLQHVVAGARRRLAETFAQPALSGVSEAAASPLHADAYGTRQVLLARTAAAKLFGLHSSTGATIWSRFVPPSAAAGASPALRTFTVRDAHHVAHLAVIAQEAHAWRLLMLNPYTGRVLAEETPRAGTLLHVAKLPLSSAESEHCLLLVDGGTLGATLHPQSAACAAQLEAAHADIYFYTRRDRELQGFGLARAAGGGYSAVARWGMQLPEGEIYSASLPQDAAVHSPVRIKGDRSVLHKYVNRNVFAVGAVTPPTAEGEEGSGAVQVLLVDGVSGRVLHSASHSGAAGPLSLLMGEHYLIYSFWKPELHRHLIAVSELYTKGSGSDDATLDIVTKLALSGPLDYSERSNHFDAYGAPAPQVLSQAYAFASSVAAMGLTLTAKGMTPKHVLIATADGKLISLPKQLLDPRRPLVAPQKMTQHDREEGLISYSPTLGGLNPLTVISHRHRIARPRAIVAAPTMLESTSLVLTYGLDLFLTRVAPAREFDRLNEDFNYLALVGATAFLIVATVGSTWLSARKDLGSAWK